MWRGHHLATMESTPVFAPFDKTKNNAIFRVVMGVLRGEYDIGSTLYEGGHIHWSDVLNATSYVVGETLDGLPDWSRALKKGDIAEHPEYKGFFRATYGHARRMAITLYGSEYMPYTGPERIFCFTHTDMDGLGAINKGRKFNRLTTPARNMCTTGNKGVTAFVDVFEARAMGIEFWVQRNDWYGNTIFCFSPALRNAVFDYAYTAAYVCRVYAPTMPGKTASEKLDNAYLQLQRLVITDEDEE